MNSKFQFDKKQLPQVVAMSVLSAGLFGYFGWRMLAPPPTQAALPSTPKAAAPSGSPSQDASIVGSTGQMNPAGADPGQLTAAAPSMDMRDPFVAQKDAETGPVTTVKTAPLPSPDKPARVAGMPTFPSIQPLTLGGLPPSVPAAPVVPPPPAEPTWQVTGVIMGSDDTTSRVAVLRSGDQHRYVRPGQMVDDQYRVSTVDSNGVTLTHGAAHFRLTLGSASPTALKHVPVPNGADSVAVPEAPAPVATSDSSIHWMTDYAAAVAKAKASHKLLMVDVYTQWCGWCKKLDSDVYTDAQVVALSEKYVCVKLDAEHGGQAVAARFAVDGYPTILFLNPNGALVAKFAGYVPAAQFAHNMEVASVMSSNRERSL